MMDINKQLSGVSQWARQSATVVIIILLFFCPLSGLDPDKQVDQYLTDHWSASDGLPSDAVYAIAQTPDGYLWISTPKGLARFDGIKLSVIHFVDEETMPDTLLVDSEGILWIGSAAGLTSYRYQTGQFKTYTPADGITRDRVRRIKEDMRGNLWISFFASYVNRFSNGKFTVFNASHGLEGKKINGIVEDQKGNLLFGSRENGVFVYRDGRFFKYPIPALEKLHIITMYEDQKGELWIGTDKGLFRVTDNGTFKYTTLHGLSNDYITNITQDSDGNLWAGTVKGLNRIKKKPEGSVRFESLLEDITPYCLFEDNEKNLWVGTFDSGLKRLKNGKFISYPPLKDREEMIFSQFQDRHGNTWIGTLEGKLFRCRDNEFIESMEISEIAGTGILAVADDTTGNLWLGTNGNGVFQKRKNGKTLHLSTAQGLADNLVTSIFRDSGGRLWFGTFDGVSRYRDGVIDTLKSTDGLSGKRVHNVYEDRAGNILIAADKGVTVLKGGVMEKNAMTHLLPDVSVTCIYEDPSAPAEKEGAGTFWIATHGAGLKRLKDETVVSFTVDHGMTSNFIYQFMEDEQENFWLMSDSGILRVGKQQLNRYAEQGTGKDRINCTSFGISDGLQSIEFNNEFSRHSALKAANGEFRVITKKGITVVNPQKIQINKFLPPVVIEAVLFNEEPVTLHREEYVFKGINEALFHFTAPTFISPEKITFKFRLEGVDRDWQFLGPGKERTARYKDLEPGTYTFRVIAGNSEGVWNRTGDSITFTLKPLFHQTLVFKIFVILFFIALLTAAFYLVIKRPFKKQEKYKGSTINDQFAAECIKKLTVLMEDKKIYRDADISLQLLADHVKVTTHVLSQILNEKLNRNYSDFINSYRVEEAKKILESPQAAQLKINTVAFDVGFNTQVAFYNAFKKYTGMTPAQYRKQVGEKK
jgi:ligand-binding sensor domain-containing protein/AraC-like DNA-binding protein